MDPGQVMGNPFLEDEIAENKVSFIIRHLEKLKTAVQVNTSHGSTSSNSNVSSSSSSSSENIQSQQPTTSSNQIAVRFISINLNKINLIFFNFRIQANTPSFRVTIKSLSLTIQLLITH